jgi:hypothetical protein
MKEHKVEKLIGNKYNHLLVIELMAERAKNGARVWLCKCDCGKMTFCTTDQLKLNHKKSCGCLQKEITKITNKLRSKYPNDTGTRLYRIWKTMIARTIYPSQKGYKNYGGRGIRVCDEWLYDFNLFKNWAIENGYSQELSIDRINNDGNYEPNNCKWSSRKEQNNNQRTNVKLTYKGKTYNISQWSEIIGVKYNTLHKRYQRKYPIEKILKEYNEYGK